MTTEELCGILKRHEEWLRNPDIGERANLLGANLRKANLRGADLRGADLLGADLQGANLRKANLREADLQGANLRKANLREADLREADLQGANLREADLLGADLREADLDYASWPLWCGSLKAKADDRLIIQLLFHTISLAQQSDISDQLRTALDTDNLVEQANRFHRAGECGPLGRWPEEENNHERAAAETKQL